MSATTHTNYDEPWQPIAIKGGWDGVGDNERRELFAVSLNDPKYKQRAIACVNALAGIPDPAAAIQAVKQLLSTIYDDTEGYADGAPDASAHDKVCNHVSSLAKQALALLTPKP